ncbi:MAG: acyl carrier protein [Actinomycetota bacterium]|nr:acyl carrier protein [Actinomycetota bacterium]
MERAQALSELQSILVEQLGVDASEVVETASFQEDLNADSLDLVEMIMEMEDKFGVKIPDEDAEKIVTVGNAVDYIVARSGS